MGVFACEREREREREKMHVLCVRVCVRETYCVCCTQYGVATVSRIDQIIGLFRRIASLLQGSFAKETYHFIDPTNRSKPITL